MVQIIKKIIQYLGTAIILFILQIGIKYLFFYPFSQINIALVFFIWKIIHKNDHGYYWVLLIYYILSDIFSTLAFGLPAVSAFISIAISKNLFRYFVTTFSWYSIILLGCSVFFIYRFIIYITAIILPQYISSTGLKLSIQNIYYSIFEIFINCAVLFLIYNIISIFKPKKKYYSV